MSIQPSQRPEMLRLIEGCLNDMCRWFIDNKLVCNRDKTQFMYSATSGGSGRRIS